MWLGTGTVPLPGGIGCPCVFSDRHGTQVLSLCVLFLLPMLVRTMISAPSVSAPFPWTTKYDFSLAATGFTRCVDLPFAIMLLPCIAVLLCSRHQLLLNGPPQDCIDTWLCEHKSCCPIDQLPVFPRGLPAAPPVQRGSETGALHQSQLSSGRRSAVRAHSGKVGATLRNRGNANRQSAPPRDKEGVSTVVG